MHFNARMCGACYALRQAQANRANQRKRRQWEKRKRHLAAGLLQKNAYFVMAAEIRCAHCGEPFRPQRSSARYCSVRCRVAAHRNKK
jgi:hypothetical protein